LSAGFEPMAFISTPAKNFVDKPPIALPVVPWDSEGKKTSPNQIKI
jgi:hypothetical protein